MGIEKTVEKGKTVREDQLQFLRFLAFLNIFCYHAESWVFFQYPVSHCAFAAVSFFFMLSGLVTGYSSYGREQKAGIKPFGEYIWKKIKRIYPLYCCTVLFMAITGGIPQMIATRNFQMAKQPLRQVLRNLLLLQSWSSEGYYDFNGAGWFLSSILFLHALSYPGMLLLKKAGKSSKRYFLFAFMIGCLLFGTVAYCYLTQQYDMSYWHYIFPPARIGEYFVGMILGVILKTIKPRISADYGKRIIFTVLEIAVLFYWYKSLYSPGNYWRNHIVSWLIPNIAVLCVYGMGMGWVSALFRRTPFVLLGDISFECYLLHQILINQYALRKPDSMMAQADKIIAFAVCLGASILLSLLLNKNAGHRKKPGKLLSRF